MSKADRVADRVRGLCAEAATTAELLTGVRDHLEAALGFAGSLLSATDPETIALGTGTTVENLPEVMAVPWMQNEYLASDVNKFEALHMSGGKPATLHRTLQGQPDLSPRFHDVYVPHGFGPELRVTFSAGRSCFGVVNLVREAHDEDFTDEDLRLLDAVRSDIALGLRRTARNGVGGHEGTGPGVDTAYEMGAPIAMTPEAERFLSDLWLCPFNDHGGAWSLPGEAYMVVMMARARAQDRRRIPASTRLVGRSGRWLTLRGDCTVTEGGDVPEIVLIIGESNPSEILPKRALAYGLSARERDVVGALLHGCSTAQVARRLHISEHTVRDHVKALLSKTGTASRAELVSVLTSA